MVPNFLNLLQTSFSPLKSLSARSLLTFLLINPVVISLSQSLSESGVLLQYWNSFILIFQNRTLMSVFFLHHPGYCVSFACMLEILKFSPGPLPVWISSELMPSYTMICWWLIICSTDLSHELQICISDAYWKSAFKCPVSMLHIPNLK